MESLAVQKRQTSQRIVVELQAICKRRIGASGHACDKPTLKWWTSLRNWIDLKKHIQV